jgi:cation diffusion facilitator family transporter
MDTHNNMLGAKRRAAGLSIAVNVVLFGLKAVVGALTGSIALWASAADSLLDLTASVFAFIGVNLGSRPPDARHAYGHHKFESLSSLVQLAMLFITVGIIASEAWARLFGEPSVSTPLAGVAVILVSLVVDAWMTRMLRRTASEAGGSQALEADALHFATDVYSNIAVIIGLVAVRLGAPIADPIAALVVAALVAVTALGLVRETAGVLTDRAPDPATVQRLHAALHSVDRVVAHHTLRARMVGSRIFLDVCVELDPTLTFHEAHDLSHLLQERLRTAVPEVADAVIHVEPAGHPEHQDAEHHSHGFDALAYDLIEDQREETAPHGPE